MIQLRPKPLHRVLLLAGLIPSGLLAQQNNPRVNASAPHLKSREVTSTETGMPSIILDVVVRNKAGDQIKGLDEKDFVLLDNKRRIPLDNLKVLSGDNGDADSQLVFVIDAINSSLQELTTSEDALEGFLQEHGGRLEKPTTILVVADSEPRETSSQAQSSQSATTALRPRELFVHRIPASVDGLLLTKSLEQYKAGLRRILQAEGGLGQAERVRLSLEALSFIATAEASVPGAKLVLWLSPGWPFLARSEARSSEQLFNSIIYFSNLLRSSRILLYSISPQGVAARDSSSVTEGFLLNSRHSAIQANGHAPGIPTELSDTYYEEFLKGVRTAQQSNPNDLALQVLAYQTGGLVLQNNNDVRAQIRRCASDATALYRLSFTPTRGSGIDVYHELQVSLATSSQPLRTRTGLYAR